MDHLYAFFVQWSPNIYGGEDEIDPAARGFVVVDENEQQFMEMVEDYYKSETRGRMVRTVSKDWEVRKEASQPQSESEGFLLTELSALKTQLVELPQSTMRVFSRVSFKRKRGESGGSQGDEGSDQVTHSSLMAKGWQVRDLLKLRPRWGKSQLPSV